MAVDYAVTEVIEDSDDQYLQANDGIAEIRDMGNGEVSIDCSAGGTITVSDADFGKFALALTGAPAADFTLRVPSFKRFFLVQNATGRIATVDTVAGSTTMPTVPPGGRALLRIAADDDLTVEGLNLYELGFFFGGKPGAGALLARFVFTRPVTWPAGLPLAQGYAGTAPADANQSIDIKRNGTSVGAADFAQTTGAFSVTFTSTTAFAVGDRVEFVGPAVQDAAFADISLTVPGIRTN